MKGKKCKKCGTQAPKDGSWDLKFMGHFCGPCAKYVLAYWTINTDTALDKVLLAEAERKRRTA